MPPLIDRCSEKYAKKLIGKTDLEDALNQLDKLTHEQAQMATVQVQRATDAIDETAGGVTEQVLTVDDRPASVNDEIAEVIDGAQIIIGLAGETFNLNHLDGNEAKRLSSPNVVSTTPLPSAKPLSSNEHEQPDLSSIGQATSSTSNLQLIVDAGRLRQNNWNRPFKELVCHRARTIQFS